MSSSNPQPPDALPPRGATATLSESESKAFLAPYGVPIAPEQVVDTPAQAAKAAAT